MPADRHDQQLSTGDQLRRELRDTGVAFRVLAVLYLAIGAFGGLYGGFLLLHETRHWISWLIALIIVEPIGMACTLAFVAIVAPDSFVSSLLFSALRRATVGVVVIGVALFAFIIGTLTYVAWYFIAAG